MKTILLIFIFALSLKADTIYDAKCVSTFLVVNTSTNTKLIKITFSDTTKPITSITYDQNILDSLVFNLDKFYYPQQGSYFCIPKSTNYNYLGMTEENFNISMAFYGIFLSSLIAFGLIKAF